MTTTPPGVPGQTKMDKQTANTPHVDETPGRQKVARLASLSAPDFLEDCLDEFFANRPIPSWRLVRGPESGLVMLRARIGGNGDLFNAGEALVTRCVIKTDRDISGAGYVLGEEARHAELAALLDALWQDPGLRGHLKKEVLPRLERAIVARVREEAARTGKTRVEFFTMVRGEDKD